MSSAERIAHNPRVRVSIDAELIGEVARALSGGKRQDLLNRSAVVDEGLRQFLSHHSTITPQKRRA